MKYVLGRRSRKRLEGVRPELIKLVEYSLNHKDCPYDFGIPRYGGLRTVEDQQELYAKGRTKSGRIVTYTDGIKRKSNHQMKSDGYGHAFDIYGLVDGSPTWSPKVLEKIASHIKKCAEELNINIEWGGDWKKFRDMPHFQLK